MSSSSQSSMSIIGLPNDVAVTKAGGTVEEAPKPAQPAEKKHIYFFPIPHMIACSVTTNNKRENPWVDKKSLVFLDEERSREVIANEDHGMMIMLANADENQE